MIVLDATVVVKLITREAGADVALNRVAPESDRIAPDWVRLEVANALARKVKSGALSAGVAATARAALDSFLTDEPIALDLIDDAYDLALQLAHPIYDCLYLALAVREGATLVTHDAAFARAASRGGFADRIELLT